MNKTFLAFLFALCLVVSYAFATTNPYAPTLDPIIVHDDSGDYGDGGDGGDVGGDGGEDDGGSGGGDAGDPGGCATPENWKDEHIVAEDSKKIVS